MNNFFSIIYMLLGTAAFIVSFKIETLFLFQITGEYWISTLTIAIFEFSKVGTIVVQRYLFLLNKFKSGTKHVSIFVRGLTLSFQVLLIVVSFLCSLAMIANYLDKPNMVKAQDEDRKLLDAKYEVFYNEITKYYEGEINGVSNEIKAEMTNVVKGSFVGPKYRELQRRRRDLEKQYNDERTKLQDRKTEELTKLADKSYSSDERVQNKMISAFLGTLSKGLGINISYVTFTLLFSSLICFLLEATIYVVFNYTTINYFEYLSRNLTFENGVPVRIDNNMKLAAGPNFLTKLFLIPKRISRSIDDAKTIAEEYANHQELPKPVVAERKNDIAPKAPVIRHEEPKPVEAPKPKNSNQSFWSRTLSNKSEEVESKETKVQTTNKEKIEYTANSMVTVDPITGKIILKN